MVPVFAGTEQMSQTRSYPIRCPQCGHEQSVELFDSINVTEDPSLRQALMSWNLNAVACPACSARFRVDKPLLYNDSARRLMIYLIPLREETLEQGEEQFRESLARLNEVLPADVMPPEVHLVFSQVELVERAFLFEAGLDERIVEYVKYLMYTRNESRLDPARKVLLFDAEDSTSETLCFVVQDTQSRQLEAVLAFGRAEYAALCEMFDSDEQTANLLELFPGPYISARALLLREQQIEESTDSP